MPRPELVNYLKEGVKRGFSMDVLKEKLKKEGWPEEFVNEAENSIKSEPKIKKLPVTEIHEGDKIPIGVFLIAIFHYFIAASILVSTIYAVFVTNIFSFFLSNTYVQTFSFWILGIGF